MDSAQLRLCLFDVLRNLATNGVNQLGGHMMREVAHHAASREFMGHQPRGSERLPDADQQVLHELSWSLIIQGVIVPGLNPNNPELPFFALTEYGREVINSPDPVPHDPDQYLAHLRGVAPTLDPIALSYVSEGLECFQRGTYTAAVVMLGVAAEKVTLDLASTVQQRLPAAEGSNLLRAIERDGIARVYEEVRKRLNPHIPRLPPALRDGLDHYLDGIFSVVRTHRNQAGHPTGQKLDRLTAFGLFSTFPFYCQRACKLVEHIQANGLP